MNKICVYAICKNEQKFVDKWLSSMCEADYIVVLDTGSTDETYNLLKNDERVFRVEQKVINPWRFDVARNESLKLVPEDANILLCTDLDEVLEPGWADEIRENWQDGFHVRGNYLYAWSHNEIGEPARIFYYDKLHDKNWHWEAPVHEMLTANEYNDEYIDQHTLVLSEKVFLHHYPDNTKSRSSYLPLLELRAEERPDDYYGIFYLAHEQYYRGQYKKSINTLNYLLTNFSDKFNTIETAAAYLFLGDNYRNLNDDKAALLHYQQAINIDETYREPYLLAAEVCNQMKMYNLAIGYVKEALQKTYRHYNWLERDNSWLGQVDDILSISYYYTGEIQRSYCHCLTALKFNPDDQRIIYNEKFIKNELLNK